MVFKDQRKLPVSSLGGHRQTPPPHAGELGEQVSVLDGWETTDIYASLSLPPTSPHSFLFQALQMVFWENLAFLETTNQEIRWWKQYCWKLSFLKARCCFLFVCLFVQGLMCVAQAGHKVWIDLLSAGSVLLAVKCGFEQC